MKTEHLIDHLVGDLRPVQALRPPWVRAAWWLLGAVAYMGLLTVALTSREDLEANGASWRFVAPQVAALLMAVTAAAAAFESTIPGSARRMSVAAAAAATLWVASLLPAAIGEWRYDRVFLAVPEEWLCVALAVLGGALPAFGMAAMLRRGVLLAPALTAALGAVSIAALANVVACLSHPHPSSAVTLVWHAGTIAALAALASWSGRAVLGGFGEQPLAR
jgi:hypothetical protein